MLFLGRFAWLDICVKVSDKNRGASSRQLTECSDGYEQTALSTLMISIRPGQNDSKKRKFPHDQVTFHDRILMVLSSIASCGSCSLFYRTLVSCGSAVKRMKHLVDYPDIVFHHSIFYLSSLRFINSSIRVNGIETAVDQLSLLCSRWWITPMNGNAWRVSFELCLNDVLCFRTEFETLPPEIVHLICDYLSGQDAIRAFLSINHRLDGIVGRAPLHTVDLSHYTRRELTNFMKASLPLVSEFLESFTLSNSDMTEDHCSANIEFVFSSLIDPSDLYSHWNHLQQITFIRPLVDSMICLPDLFLQSFFLYPSRDRIILRKSISTNRIPVLMICSLEVLRSSLVNHGGLYDQVLVGYRNTTVNSLMPRVRHLKFHIDNYEQQWSWMSPLINAALVEFTVILQDNRFTDYYGHMFSSLVEKISVQCRLHFFLRVCSTQLIAHTNMDNLVQSFHSDFYTEHQSNVTIAYSRYALQSSYRPLLIYTSPLCISKLTLVENQEVIGPEVRRGRRVWHTEKSSLLFTTHSRKCRSTLKHSERREMTLWLSCERVEVSICL